MANKSLVGRTGVAVRGQVAGRVSFFETEQPTGVLPEHQGDWRRACEGPHGLAVACRRRAAWTYPAPGDLAKEREIVQPVRIVGLEPAREQVLLPVPGGSLEALKLLHESQQPCLAEELGLRMCMLMANQKANELLWRDRSDLAAKPFEGQAMNAGEQASLAPFKGVAFRLQGGEVAAQNGTLGLQRGQAHFDIRRM